MAKELKDILRRKSKTQLVKKLDSVYSKYIRDKYAKDGYVSCVTCGKSDRVENMQNGHYVSRSHYSTRWLDKNCHPQCYRCNVALHGNYVQYTLFMMSTYGNDVVEELSVLSKQTPKYSKLDLWEMTDYYIKQYKVK